MIEIINLIGEGIFILVLFALLISFIIPKDNKTKKEKCEKNPNLECPYQIEFFDNGGFRVHGSHQCCKVKEKRKKIHNMFMKMEVGKNYNGLKITKEFKKQVMDSDEYMKNIDDSGPTL